jgi:Cu(I)/Ag(I) efflux system membrane protein CusA/SilA
MTAKIIELALKHRFLVVLTTALFVAAGVWRTLALRLDAIPDLSDVQVIVTAEHLGQNPEVVDDQVTYPLASAMLSVPGATAVRGFSMFEQSFVYVLFDDGTDLYWARSRVLEYLNFARDRLPAGVELKLGPDATGVGWVYQYVLFPGWYCAEHPKGLWRVDESNTWYPTLTDVPDDERPGARRVRGFEADGACPLDGEPLVASAQDLAALRTLQDWYLRYPLSAVQGVSEVASIGGFVKQYQVVLDPHRLLAHGIVLGDLIEAIQSSNADVGGSVIELSENEYMIRSRGYLQGTSDLAKVPVGLGAGGLPILLGDVATLTVGGEARRGVGEYNGVGEAVGAVVVARFGVNANEVIRAVKARLFELEDSLPAGVFIRATYDRSQLIERAVTTLRDTLIEEIVVVGLVCILFLLHARSELVAVFVVPASVVIAVLAMDLLGMNANIMSLGGIALSIGVVVDSAIIMVENAHKHLDRDEELVHAGAPPRPRAMLILEAAKEVGPQLFFSLLVITVSFLPVFVLEGEAGRLFKPLAYTKTFAMAAAAVLSITVIPVLMVYFITARVLPARWGRWANFAITLAAMLLPAVALLVLLDRMHELRPLRWWIAGGWAVFMGMLLVPQRIVHEDRSPLSRVLQWAYTPIFAAAMRHPWLVIAAAVAALLSTAYPISRLGTEFMPSLDEGDLLYMPTTDPSISVTKSKELLQQTDKLIKTFPEVVSVHGKIGRADSATDPAPLSMIETVIQLDPDRATWRTRPVERFFSDWPDFLQGPLAAVWPATRPITTDELTFGWTEPDGTMHAGLNSVVAMPGLANAWPYPIENRINMLSTGIKTPVGIKILGPDLDVLADLADRATQAVLAIDGTVSAYPDRSLGGLYLDIDIDRESAARYGLTVGDVQAVIETAVGGKNITTTVEGQERYPLNVRYARELRDDVPALQQVLVATPSGAPVTLGQLATIRISQGPPMIRSENAQRTAWVFIDVEGRDLGGYIEEARRVVAASVELPPGYSLRFAGQFEFWEESVPRLVAASIVTLVLIVVLLYASSGSWLRVGIVMLAVPFSLIGALWFVFALDYNLSLAVAIGMIALAGLDAETGMVMLLYLDTSFERARRQGRMSGPSELWHAVHDGAVKRIRPKAMTVAAAFIGLLPLLWAEGTGADVMRRLAAPMIGGLVVSFAMELVVYPVLFYFAKRSQRGTFDSSPRRETGAEGADHA